MSIKYFPNRVFKKNDGAIDRVLAKRNPQIVRGQATIGTTAIDTYISSNSDWQINSIMFTFNNATARNYSVAIASGLKVVTDLNDTLWFQTPTTLRQRITLAAGFYTGTTLAAQLKAQLDANAAYAAAGVTFTVAYSETTGLFTITPSSGTLKYIQTNNKQQLSWRDSAGGHLLGLTSDTAFGGTVVSDTVQYGLNAEAWIIDETASIVTEHYNDDIHVLTMDQSLHVTTNTAAVTVTYIIGYEDIV